MDVYTCRKSLLTTSFRLAHEMLKRTWWERRTRAQNDAMTHHVMPYLRFVHACFQALFRHVNLHASPVNHNQTSIGSSMNFELLLTQNCYIILTLFRFMERVVWLHHRFFASLHNSYKNMFSDLQMRCKGKTDRFAPANVRWLLWSNCPLAFHICWPATCRVQYNIIISINRTISCRRSTWHQHLPGSMRM
jgi:hypothetical protein